MALGPIVGRRDWTYLVSIRPNSWPVEPRDVDARDRFCCRIPAFASALLIAAAVGIVLAATVALWAHYGTAVFYEMIVAGIAACL